MPSAAHARIQGSADEEEHEKVTPRDQSASEMTGSFHLGHPGEEESESGQEAAEGARFQRVLSLARGLRGRFPGDRWCSLPVLAGLEAGCCVVGTMGVACGLEGSPGSAGIGGCGEHLFGAGVGLLVQDALDGLAGWASSAFSSSRRCCSASAAASSFIDGFLMPLFLVVELLLGGGVGALGGLVFRFEHLVLGRSWRRSAVRLWQRAWS